MFWFFLQLICRMPPPPTTTTPPLLCAALQEFLSDQCLRPLYSHSVSSDTWPLPPPAVLPPSLSLIGPDIDGNWMLANDCLRRLFMPPLLTLPVTPCRLHLHASRSPAPWIGPSVFQLAESFSFMLHLYRLLSLDFHVCAKFLWRFLGSPVVSCRPLLPTCFHLKGLQQPIRKWWFPTLSLIHIFIQW